MELDTGFAISVIPIKMYRQLISHRPLSATNTTLRTYSGQIIKPAGIIHVNMKYEDQEHNLYLFVVKNNSPAVFGRSWLNYFNLDWTSIKLLQTSISTEDQLRDILTKFKKKLCLKEHNRPISNIRGVW